MNQLEQSLLAANQQRYDEAKNPLKSHGPDHHLRVYQHALTLADKLGVRFDPDVLAGACLLHDMAAYYPDRTGDDYHDYDHKLAEEILASIDFPKDKIQLATEAIAHHGSDPKYKNQDESTETRLLRDADKLDVFGPIGVARVVMVRSLKGDTLDDIVADFYTGGHLQRKWDSISTDEARQMGQADFNYSMKFFERLAASLDETKHSDRSA
jgi:HD superfamily phosphodiesterase